MDELSKGDIKLTAAGYLPTKYVKELYSLGVPDFFVEKLGYKVSSEKKSESVLMVHATLKCARLIKERKGMMSLTEKGREILSDHNLLNKVVTEEVVSRMNLGYFDLYEGNEIGNFGTTFSLVIIHRNSPDWHAGKEYAKAYFEAFPDMLEESDCQRPESCYVCRVLERLCTNFLGVCELRHVRKDSSSPYLTQDEYRTLPTFDTLFSFRDPISPGNRKNIRSV